MICDNESYDIYADLLKFDNEDSNDSDALIINLEDTYEKFLPKENICLNTEIANNSNTEDDLYSDILDKELEIREINHKESLIQSQCLQSENEKLKSEICKLSKENSEVNTQNSVLLQNISALFKTAEAEIKRKSLEIHSLREKLDDMIFRRRKKVQKPNTPFTLKKPQPRNSKSRLLSLRNSEKHFGSKTFSDCLELNKSLDKENCHKNISLNKGDLSPISNATPTAIYKNSEESDSKLSQCSIKLENLNGFSVKHCNEIESLKTHDSGTEKKYLNNKPLQIAKENSILSVNKHQNRQSSSNIKGNAIRKFADEDTKIENLKGQPDKISSKVNREDINILHSNTTTRCTDKVNFPKISEKSSCGNDNTKSIETNLINSNQCSMKEVIAGEILIPDEILPKCLNDKTDNTETKPLQEFYGSSQADAIFVNHACKSAEEPNNKNLTRTITTKTLWITSRVISSNELLTCQNSSNLRIENMPSNMIVVPKLSSDHPILKRKSTTDCSNDSKARPCKFNKSDIRKEVDKNKTNSIDNNNSNFKTLIIKQSEDQIERNRQERQLKGSDKDKTRKSLDKMNKRSSQNLYSNKESTSQKRPNSRESSKNISVKRKYEILYEKKRENGFRREQCFRRKYYTKTTNTVSGKALMNKESNSINLSESTSGKNDSKLDDYGVSGRTKNGSLRRSTVLKHNLKDIELKKIETKTSKSRNLTAETKHKIDVMHSGSERKRSLKLRDGMKCRETNKFDTRNEKDQDKCSSNPFLPEKSPKITHHSKDKHRASKCNNDTNEVIRDHSATNKRHYQSENRHRDSFSNTRLKKRDSIKGTRALEDISNSRQRGQKSSNINASTVLSASQIPSKTDNFEFVLAKTFNSGTAANSNAKCKTPDSDLEEGEIGSDSENE